MQKYAFGIAQANSETTYLKLSLKYYMVNSDIRFCEVFMNRIHKSEIIYLNQEDKFRFVYLANEYAEF